MNTVERIINRAARAAIRKDWTATLNECNTAIAALEEKIARAEYQQPRRTPQSDEMQQALREAVAWLLNPEGINERIAFMGFGKQLPQSGYEVIAHAGSHNLALVSIQTTRRKSSPFTRPEWSKIKLEVQRLAPCGNIWNGTGTKGGTIELQQRAKFTIPGEIPPPGWRQKK